MSASEQIRVRVPPAVAAELAALSPRLRAGAVSVLLVSAIERVDLVALLGAVEELRRLAVNLNQLTRVAHINRGLDDATIQRVEDVVSLIEKLRGRA